MAKFRVDVEWGGRLRRVMSKVVEAADAVDALDWASPGSWREGDFDWCEIKIVRTEEKTDAKTE